jgi:hypothetical protein
METATIENAAALAVAKLKQIQAPAEAKAKEEAKVAEADKAKAEQAKKDEGIKLAVEQEAKLKEDARILSESDETKLQEVDKKRKAELIKAKEVEENTPEAKIKRVQEATQKRIDEIKSEQLARENKQAEELARLKAELEELKKPKQVEDVKAKVKREHAEQIAKYVKDDADKPKEDRREMSKDDLDAWYLEDPVECSAWINRREIRRDRELSKLEESVSKPADNTAEKQRIANEFISKQNESRAKLLKRFPEIVPSKEDVIEAKKAAGVPTDRNLTEEEAGKVNAKLDEKLPMFKLAREISFSDTKKYIESTEGPELVMAEMEKRLASKTVEKQSYTWKTQKNKKANYVKCRKERQRGLGFQSKLLISQSSVARALKVQIVGKTLKVV